ncbi:hypothetical protein GCM10028895_05030 [Pontibacter rugosus]
MPGLYSRYIKPVHALGDLAAIAISSIASYGFAKGGYLEYFAPENFQLLLYSLISWIVCASLLGTYKVYRVTRILRVIANALKVVFLYILLVEATLSFLNIETFSRQFLTYHYTILAVLVIVWRIVVVVTLRYFRRKGYNYRTVIIVGHNKAAEELKKFFKKHPEYGYRFLGFFDDHAKGEPHVLGSISDIENFVLTHQVDEIYCCPYELQQDQIQQLLGFVDNNLVRMKFLPEPGEFHLKQMKVDFYDVLPVLILRSIPLDDAANKVLKRGFDVLFHSL